MAELIDVYGNTKSKPRTTTKKTTVTPTVEKTVEEKIAELYGSRLDYSNINAQIGQMGDIGAPTAPKVESNPLITETVAPTANPTMQDVYALPDAGKINSDIGQMGDAFGKVDTKISTGALTGDEIAAGETNDPEQDAAVVAEEKAYNDYATWYKAQTGKEFEGNNMLTKPVGMDYATWATGQTLYNLYDQTKAATDALASQNGQITNEQSREEQQAYITYQKMQKYIQMANQAQGTRGISAGDQIAMGNNYQNTLGGIGSTYSGLKLTAEQTAAAAKQKALSSAQENLSTIYSSQENEAKAKAETETAKTEAETAKTEAEAQARIDETAALVANKLDDMYSSFEVDEETGEISYEDYQKMVAFYNQYKDTLDDDTRASMEFILKNNYDYADAAPVQIDSVAGADTSGNSNALIGRSFSGYTIESDSVASRVQATSAGTNGQIINEANAANQPVYVYYDGYLYPVRK